jgi:hypothetical protein
MLLVFHPWASAQAPLGGDRPSLYRRVKRKSPSVVADEIKQAYKTNPLLVQQAGLMGTPSATTMGVAVAILENGTLRAPGWRDRMFSGEDLYWFQPGDRVFAEKCDVDAKHDKVTFTLVSPDRNYRTGLHVKFPKGFLGAADAGQIYDAIGKALAFESGNSAQAQEQVSQAPPPSPQPPPVTAPAPQPAPQTAAASTDTAVAPLLFDGQVVGFGPPGAVLLPPDQPPASADGRAWVPVVRNGQIVAYAPPGSVIWPQRAPAAAAPAPASALAPTGPAPRTITLGQSGEEVQAILGTPEKIANLGSKVIFVYKDLKITLTEGKVTDVQ